MGREGLRFFMAIGCDGENEIFGGEEERGPRKKPGTSPASKEAGYRAEEMFPELDRRRVEGQNATKAKKKRI